MRFSILVLSFLFGNALMAATVTINVMGPRMVWALREFEIFSNSIAQLKKKITTLKTRIQEANDTKSAHSRDKQNNDDEMKRKIFEKYLLSRANGTSVLKDFYPGRYLV